jgi:outer membrane receptor protein involved in Fe transport
MRFSGRIARGNDGAGKEIDFLERTAPPLSRRPRLDRGGDCLARDFLCKAGKKEFMTKRVLITILLGAVVSLAGQIKAGEIRIEVRDPAGNAMEAGGKLVGLASEVDRAFETDPQGSYTFSMLPYGRYRLEISRDGFATQSALIDVQSETPVFRTLTMAIGASAYKLDVVSATPLPGVELQLQDIPAPVQSGTGRDIDQSGARDLSDFMNRRLEGVHVNEVQGNPFQADLNYRGLTASPLLGTPQGLSVYMDGVRLNQPFGDVVSWDLIPRIAISETALMPGSNPVFGLNTLGGAISAQTKTGSGKPSTTVQMSGGSFRRGTFDVEHGGANSAGLNWYLAGSGFFEDGWRDDSPSNVRQLFGKLGWQSAKTVVGLTFSYANNSLTGNGVQEQRFIERDYNSVYTKPDITNNRSPFLNFTVRHSLRNNLSLTGNVYYRYIRTKTFNGDSNEDSLDQAIYQPTAAERAALAAAGYTGVPASGATAENTPFPFWRCIGNILLRDEPAEKCNGLLNHTRTKQHNAGASGQFTWFGSANGHHHQLTVGGGFDGSSAYFLQSTELGYINPDRSISGAGGFGDGVTGGSVDGEPFDTRVDLDGHVRTGSVYATDTLSLGKGLSMTLAGRYNRTTINNNDGIRPAAGPGSLAGDHEFDRFNPAAGITFSPARSLNLYLGYSEASRAPTSIEIGCADPETPCKLPNAMAGDPPLNQVVARTWEVGVRSIAEGAATWSIGYFRSDNRNDILFVASEQTGFGYFKNFGRTRRQGIEIDTRVRLSRLTFGGGYTFLDATYRSRETVNGSSNSSNEAAEQGLPGLEAIQEIEPGDRIPLTPRHMVKAFTDLDVTSKLTVDFGMSAFSSSLARGNENNDHEADGLYYLGPGRSPGYTVFDLGSRYQIHRRLQLFVQVNNLFDRKYYTAAQLGPTAFTSSGNFIARPFPAVDGEFPLRRATFYAPGAPRSAWVGLRVSF